jgi:hypothetical protein
MIVTMCMRACIRSIHNGLGAPLNFLFVFFVCTLLGVATHVLFLPIHPSAAEEFTTDATVVAQTEDSDFDEQYDRKSDTELVTCIVDDDRTDCSEDHIYDADVENPLVAKEHNSLN